MNTHSERSFRGPASVATPQNGPALRPAASGSLLTKQKMVHISRAPLAGQQTQRRRQTDRRSDQPQGILRQKTTGTHRANRNEPDTHTFRELQASRSPTNEERGRERHRSTHWDRELPTTPLVRHGLKTPSGISSVQCFDTLSVGSP